MKSALHKSWFLDPAGVWVLDAACAGLDSELFFSDARDVKAAKQVCAGCSVRAECLEWALGNEEQFGVWGGLTVGERRQEKHRRRVA